MANPFSWRERVLLRLGHVLALIGVGLRIEMTWDATGRATGRRWGFYRIAR